MHDLSPRLTSHLLVLISTVSAATLAPAQSLENQNLTAPFDDSSNVVLLNTTALSLNASNLNEGRPRCSGRMFGTAPNIASCRRAINKITPEQGERTWGMRDDSHSGPEYAVNLPWRWLSQDGLCSVQVYLVAPATVGHVSPAEVKRGAEAVFETCVVGHSLGGLASDLGGDNKLAVVVQSADNANVQCIGDPPPPHYQDCFLVVHSMFATMQRQTFGSIGDPTVENPLPHTFYSLPHGACVAVVSIPPALRETSSWYEIWDAVDAMAWMCVLNGQVGKVSGIGDQGRIGVTFGFPEDTSSTSR